MLILLYRNQLSYAFHIDFLLWWRRIFFFSFLSLMSSSQNDGISIFDPFENWIINFKIRSPFFPSNTDIISCHSFCKIRVLVLLFSPLTFTTSVITLDFYIVRVHCICHLSCDHSQFSKVFYSLIQGLRSQRSAFADYGKRADPCGTNSHIFPPWVQCDACQRRTCVASCLNGSSINYDAHQLTLSMISVIINSKDSHYQNSLCLRLIWMIAV